jgi:hypothetical protein
MQPILFKHNLLACCLEQKCEGANYSTLMALDFPCPSQTSKEMPLARRIVSISLRKGMSPGNTASTNKKTVWVVITNQISRANTIPDVVSQTVT